MRYCLYSYPSCAALKGGSAMAALGMGILLLGGISLTFGFVMCITLPAWIVVSLIQTGQMNLIEAVPFLLLCLIGLFVAGRFFWSVQEKETVPTRGEMVPVS